MVVRIHLDRGGGGGPHTDAINMPLFHLDTGISFCIQPVRHVQVRMEFAYIGSVFSTISHFSDGSVEEGGVEKIY